MQRASLGLGFYCRLEFMGNSLHLGGRRRDRGRSLSEYLAEKGRANEPVELAEEARASSCEHNGESSTDNKEKVGGSIELRGIKHIILDIFENEILELGDEIDWNFRNFSKFEAIEGGAPYDHRFYYSSCNRTNSTFEKERRILEKESSGEAERLRRRHFFIRTYTRRKDLMRVAVSVSERELPFCLGLFFFDIKFPADYPSQPPALFYHSYGRSISPNLPRDGKVSLRLSNKTKCFSILDLFLHIQEIVLNPRFYPNDLNSKQKFVSSCLTMIDMLNQPPSGYEDFVKGHFRTNAAAILQRFKEVMDLKDCNTRNFFFRLYNAFKENKAYCEHLLDSDLKQELERLTEIGYM